MALVHRVMVQREARRGNPQTAVRGGQALFVETNLKSVSVTFTERWNLAKSPALYVEITPS